VLRPSPDVVSSALGETGVLVNLRTNRIFELNATGVRAWTLIGEGHPASEIERRLRQEFDVSPEQLRSELQSLFDELTSEGLVDVAPSDRG
jgi:hypothetical protein